MELQRGKVVTVERRARKQRVPGLGLLDGMAVVWKHWQGSFRKNESFGQIHGTFTMEYPEERPRLPEAYRNLPILLYDEESGHELCTSCFQCQRICPPQVIHMTQAKDPTTGKAVPAVTEFVIEYDACMSCGFCAEVCPFDAIKMDHAFELATSDHPGLTLHREALNRPIGYYAQLAPTMWAEVREQAMKKLAGNIKRRPDVLGMAPNLAEKIAARRRELAAAPPPAAPAAPAAPAPAAPAAPPPAAPPAKLTPEEKAAKLAAIKAANAAKAVQGDGGTGGRGDGGAGGRGDGGMAPAASPVPAEETAAAPLDDKAARLAAIRAKNAAKAAAEQPDDAGRDAPAGRLPEPGDAPPAASRDAPAGRLPEPGDAPPAPADEKAARLAAIRARNAAKQAAEREQGEA